MDVDLDIHISLFDLLISGVMIWGIYKGYVQGFIIQTIALFVLLVGVFIGLKLSVSFYNTIIDNSTVALPNFPVIVFALIFGFIVFASNYVALMVQKQVTSIPKTIGTRVLGAFFGGIKYMFIISVTLIFVERLDRSFQIVTDKEKTRTTLYQPFLNFAPTILPRLKFEMKEPELMDIPEIDLTDIEE